MQKKLLLKNSRLLLEVMPTTGMPIGDLAGFIIKLYDGINDGMIVIDNAGVLGLAAAASAGIKISALPLTDGFQPGVIRYDILDFTVELGEALLEPLKLRLPVRLLEAVLIGK